MNRQPDRSDAEPPKSGGPDFLHQRSDAQRRGTADDGTHEGQGAKESPGGTSGREKPGKRRFLGRTAQPEPKETGKVQKQKEGENRHDTAASLC